MVGEKEFSHTLNIPQQHFLKTKKKQMSLLIVTLSVLSYLRNGYS